MLNIASLGSNISLHIKLDIFYKASNMVEMKVEGLTLDPLTNMPIIILKGIISNKALPIWVGYFEANAIALEIQGINTPRPMTHDLLNSMISSLHAEVKQVTINDLKDNTFFAIISIVQNGNDMTIDARPSDAIALALRTKSPIFVEDKVIEAAKELDLPDPNKIQNDEKKQWEDWITGIKPQDFGKL